MSKIEVEKTIYLVRHGESEDNKQSVFQSAHSPLSERGEDQALKLAKRATKLDFQVIISSGLERSKGTAEIIASVANRPVEHSDLFVERMKPTSLNGKSHDDLLAKQCWDNWVESLFKKGARVEDGENFDDIITRADKAIEFLANHPQKEILVVSHAFFIKTIILKILLSDSMTEDNFRNFQKGAYMKNSGLSVI